MADPKNIGTTMGFLAVINVLVDDLRSQKSLRTDKLTLKLQALIDAQTQEPSSISADMIFVLEQVLRPLLSEDLRNAHKLLEEPQEGNA